MRLRNLFSQSNVSTTFVSNQDDVGGELPDSSLRQLVFIASMMVIPSLLIRLLHLVGSLGDAPLLPTANQEVGRSRSLGLSLCLSICINACVVLSVFLASNLTMSAHVVCIHWPRSTAFKLLPVQGIRACRAFPKQEAKSSRQAFTPSTKKKDLTPPYSSPPPPLQWLQSKSEPSPNSQTFVKQKSMFVRFLPPGPFSPL